MDTNALLSSLQDSHHWDILAEHGMTILLNVAAALAIFLIGRWVSARIVRLIRLAMQRAHVDTTLIGFVSNVSSVILLIIVIMATLNKLGVPTTSVAAMLGGAGLAIGLALKDQLSNFAAGALIIFFRPFKVGDYIKVGGYEGFVKQIKIVQTTLTTYADDEIIIPNSVVMGDSITNQSALPDWRSQVVVRVGYDADLKKAQAAVLQPALDHPKCINSTNPATVQITNLDADAIEITLWAWSNEADWWTVQCDLFESVVENLRAAGIAIALPQSEVRLITPAGSASMPAVKAPPPATPHSPA